MVLRIQTFACGRGHSPLSAACITTGHDQPMDPTKLLSAGANLNTQTAEHGSIALMHAAGYGYEKGVEILLNAAADVKHTAFQTVAQLFMPQQRRDTLLSVRHS